MQHECPYKNLAQAVLIRAVKDALPTTEDRKFSKGKLRANRRKALMWFKGEEAPGEDEFMLSFELVCAALEVSQDRVIKYILDNL